MDQVIGPLTATFLGVSAAALVFIAVALWQMRDLLGKLVKEEGGPIHSHFVPQYGGVMGSAAGYAIYVYRGGRWELESDLSAPGCEPSPPTLEGSYEGQVIKKASTPPR